MAKIISQASPNISFVFDSVNHLLYVKPSRNTHISERITAYRLNELVKEKSGMVPSSENHSKYGLMHLCFRDGSTLNIFVDIESEIALKDAFSSISPTAWGAKHVTSKPLPASFLISHDESADIILGSRKQRRLNILTFLFVLMQVAIIGGGLFIAPTNNLPRDILLLVVSGGLPILMFRHYYSRLPAFHFLRSSEKSMTETNSMPQHCSKSDIS